MYQPKMSQLCAPTPQASRLLGGRWGWGRVFVYAFVCLGSGRWVCV